ncbi:hypothetical protein TNCV_4745241 [Trichonephila clavipes]|nr:hypothetical protein TNCV_4745241 [Trichonephila clavipes]
MVFEKCLDGLEDGIVWGNDDAYTNSIVNCGNGNDDSFLKHDTDITREGYLTDDLTDDFVTRNLECISILLSSIWDSDFLGFGNLGLKRGA